MRMLRATVRRRGGAVVLSLGTVGLLLLTLLGVSFVRERAAAAHPAGGAAHTAAAQAAFGKVPLAFERNDGQADASLRFVARGGGYMLGLGPTQALLAVSTTPPPTPPDLRQMPSKPQAPIATPTPASPQVLVSMSWLGANANAHLAGEQQLPGVVNYFLGNDASRWHTNIPTYKQVRYTGVYPGIDLVYYGTGSALEYDFVVAPGADPSQIALGFSGQQSLKVDLSGNLILTLPGGQALTLQKPALYQQMNGARKAVAGSYQLGGAGRVGFALGAYDHTAPLVIDPVFIYSTYLGGNGADQPYGIAVDGGGNAYITGSTTSTDFPTVGPIQANYGGNTDVFVSKLNASGSALVYSTYLGGTSIDEAHAIAVDPSGNAYITGDTDSTDFPVANPFQSTFSGGADAFVSKLNASGSALVYSTYFGGSAYDEGNGIAADSNGNAYITGRTFSSDFPTANALQASFAGGVATPNAFVSKFNPSGSALVYSTYLGGSGGDWGTAIAVDASGNAYLGGLTSTGFPTTAGAFQTSFGGQHDGFVSKLNASGTALDYSTYLGGSGSDWVNAVAVDSSGDVSVTGQTNSTDFPTVNPLQASFGGGYSDAFVTKFNASGTALVYSTYLGASGNDYAYSIAVDGSGNAYVTGTTNSLGFPLALPIQASYTYINSTSHVFVSVLNPTGGTLLFSTYVEGNQPFDTETSTAIAVDGTGSAYVAGYLGGVETDFPVTAGALQTAPGGGEAHDGFVMRLQPNAAVRNATIGVYRPTDSSFKLRYTNSTGYLQNNVTFGAPGDLPVVGDWTGKGYDSIGVYRPSTATFYLRNSNTNGTADTVVTFGASGDMPLVGDWTGKGYDSVGVYRPSTGQFLLRNSNTTGPADIHFTFGGVGDTPLVGDWTGQSKTTVGVYRSSSQTYYLRNSNSQGAPDISYSYGVSGAVPVMGDWLGQGRDTPAYVVPSSSTGDPFQWNQRYLNSAGPVQMQFLYGGAATDTPLAGQWQPGP